MPQTLGLYTSTNLIKKDISANYEFEVTATIYDIKIGGHQVISYNVHRDFINSRFPIRILSVVLMPDDYYNLLNKITPDKPFLPVNINIDVTLIETKDGNEYRNKVQYLSGTFMGMSEKTKVNDLTVNMPQGNDSYDYGLDQAYVLRLALWDLDDLNFAKYGIVSGNFGSQSIDSLLKYAYNTCCKNTMKFAPAPSDNKVGSSGTVVRALGFVQFVEFLDREYGIYKGNYNIFVENNIIYILNTEKTDVGMRSLFAGNKDDKIIIDVHDSGRLPAMMYGTELVEDHFKYNIFKNDLVEEELSIDAMMRPVNVTVNSAGDLQSSIVSSDKLETISPTITIDGGRNKTVVKENRNPTFSATVTIDDLPINVEPYTTVRYISNKRVGDCMLRSSTQSFYKTHCTTTLSISSYDKFLPYEIEPKKTGTNINKI